MSLRLHATYSMDEAIAGFEGSPHFWCDNQFAVLPDVILCFITVGETTNESHLPSPSTVIWKPSRIDYAPSDKYSWLPRDIREVFDRSGPEIVRLRRHHMFVRPHGSCNFTYAGEAHLGSYCGPTDNSVGNREAKFSLNEKLPRNLWLQCRGYSGWRIEVNHEEHLVEQSDLASFDRLLDQLRTQDYSHLYITRYEEDSLTIHTNPERAWLMYLREPADSGLYLNNPTLGANEEHFRCVCGISLDIPASQTVPHSQAAEIARHFFTVGNLPSHVEWDEA